MNIGHCLVKCYTKIKESQSKEFYIKENLKFWKKVNKIFLLYKKIKNLNWKNQNLKEKFEQKFEKSKIC